MGHYIKDGKNYFTPVKIKTEDGKIIYTDSPVILEQNGFIRYEEQSSTPKLSLEELIIKSNNTINKKTDAKILNDFVWNGNEFYLSLENQFNFKNLYDLRNMKEYPVTIKTKTGFTTLNSAEEVEDFYLSGVMFIEKCLHTCWEAKAAAEEEIRKNYEN